MTTSIGGVTLTNDMVWADEFFDPRVNASATPALGGGVIIQEFARYEPGRSITLTTQNRQGFQLKSVVEALKALADVAGATYTLSISHNTLALSKTVRFKTVLESGAVEFRMSSEMDGLQPATFYYAGSIYLMVVE
mgnify:CR=1 FL=1